MKKFFWILFVLFAFSMQANALKIKNQLQLNTLQKAEVISVEDALEIKTKINNVWTAAYVSNLNCHEYTRVYALKSSGGNTYVRPRQRTVRISRAVTEYLNKIFDEHEGNIYFKPNGVGLFGNLVGEFYIGNDSLSKHLIDKGYCDYVQ